MKLAPLGTSPPETTRPDPAAHAAAEAVPEQGRACPGPDRQRRIERVMAIVALALIAAAWVAGEHRARRSVMPAIQAAVPEAADFSRTDGVFAAWEDRDRSRLLGYVALGTADGYGGPLTLAVAVSAEGQVLNVVVADHKETGAWFDRVSRRGLPGALAGKSWDDAFVVGRDLDTVTGATVTVDAMARAVADGSQAVARAMGLPVNEAPPAPVRFGLLELTVLLLLGLVLLSYRYAFPHRKLLRWGTMLTGLLLLGFIYNSPLTLTYMARAVLGYWPSWRTDLHFYLLVVGVPAIILIARKNPYCQWFCPFGAAQECLGAVGGARSREPARLRPWLRWLPRTLALGALLLGVYLRSPGQAGYEVFGTLFGLVGGTTQFALLGLVIVASLFVLRPWCRYLCPVGAVLDFLRMLRDWAVESRGPSTRATAPVGTGPAAPGRHCRWPGG